MSRRIVRRWSWVVCASVCVSAGVLATPVAAGHHGHGSQYDLVQGYLVQPQSCPPQAPPVPGSQPQPGPSAQSPGLMAAPAPLPVLAQPAPAQPQVQFQAAPAPTMTVQWVQQAPAQTLQMATAPAPAQTLQFATAPVQTIQLATAPVQPTQVQLVQVQVATAPTLAFAPQTLSVAQPSVAAATPILILIPHQKKCHHHLFCSCK